MTETADLAASHSPFVPAEEPPYSAVRITFGGFLMGLANLVPGVSGGTMILALGLYDRFIRSVAELTSLRWNVPMVRFIALVGIGGVVAILGLSSPAVWLVTEHRWIAYSLFVGMTLGGVPELWRVVRPLRLRESIALLLGLGLMAAIALGVGGTALPHNFLVFLLIGALASSSMILPGISGSYILLIFGLYDVVVGSIRPSVLLEDPAGSFGILAPVGIGVALGIGGLANVLKLLLAKFEHPTHAALLGLMLGSVIGLWPFQQATHPELSPKPRIEAVELLLAGEDLAFIADETGVTLTAEEAAGLAETHAGKSRGDLKLLSLELERYAPTMPNLVLSLVILAFGFGVTRLLGRRSASS